MNLHRHSSISFFAGPRCSQWKTVTKTPTWKTRRLGTSQPSSSAHFAVIKHFSHRTFTIFICRYLMLSWWPMFGVMLINDHHFICLVLHHHHRHRRRRRHRHLHHHHHHPHHHHSSSSSFVFVVVIIRRRHCCHHHHRHWFLHFFLRMDLINDTPNLDIAGDTAPLLSLADSCRTR